MDGREPRNSASSLGQDAERDASVLVSVAELDAERLRGHVQEELAAADEQSARPGCRAGRRLPRPGHYPAGFSPYRMSNKHGLVQLDRRSVRNDFKVRPGLSRQLWPVQNALCFVMRLIVGNVLVKQRVFLLTYRCLSVLSMSLSVHPCLRA